MQASVDTATAPGSPSSEHQASTSPVQSSPASPAAGVSAVPGTPISPVTPTIQEVHMAARESDNVLINSDDEFGDAQDGLDDIDAMIDRDVRAEQAAGQVFRVGASQ